MLGDKAERDNEQLRSVLSEHIAPEQKVSDIGDVQSAEGCSNKLDE